MIGQHRFEGVPISSMVLRLRLYLQVLVFGEATFKKSVWVALRWPDCPA